jgi:hypothetical protein
MKLKVPRLQGESIDDWTRVWKLEKQHPVTGVSAYIYSAVGVAIACGITAEGSGFESRYGQEATVRYTVRTGPRACRNSEGMDTVRTFHGAKRPGRETNNSPLTSAGVKKTLTYTSGLPYAITAQCRHSSEQRQLRLLKI